MKFVLIKRQATPNSSIFFEWWNLQGNNKLVNYGRGYTYLLSSDVIIETVELKSWHELWTPENIAKTTEYQTLVIDSTNKNLKIGWLSPDGKMHYCKYQNHILYVHIVLDKTVPEIETEGWVHIYNDHYNYKKFYQTTKLTDAQKYTIINELGFELLETDLI